MAKKTPRDQIVSSMNAIRAYQETIKVGQQILSIPDVQKNDSTRVAQESLVRGAQENLVSEYNGIFRRIQEHADGLVRGDGEGNINLVMLKKVTDAVLNVRNQ